MEDYAAFINSFELVDSTSIIEFIISMLFSTVLALILAKFYTLTHAGNSYSKTYVHSVVLIAITITLIMIIIGSNIARAFALVGAMSIVRFRNPVKDTRDLTFIFAAIAIGMACGTKFYLYGLIFLVFFCSILLFFSFSDFGAMKSKTFLLKISLNKDKRHDANKFFKENTAKYSIISIDNNESSLDIDTIVVEFTLENKILYSNFIDKFTNLISPKSINLLIGEGSVGA